MISKIINSELIGKRIIKDYICAFNSRDQNLMASLFNFPHIRFANGKAWVISKKQYLSKQEEVTLLLKKENWNQTIVNNIETIQSGNNKAHFKIHFSRLNNENKIIHDFETLWIVTNLKGHWGIQFRSTFLDSDAATFGLEIK